MKIRACPECGFANPENEWECYYCGTTLSQSMLVDDKYKLPEKIDLLRDLHSTSERSAQLEAITRLTRFVKTDWDIFRYLRKLAIVAADPDVRQAAAEASQPGVAKFRPDSLEQDGYEEYAQYITYSWDELERAHWVRTGYIFAASFLLIDAVVKLGYGLSANLSFEEYGMGITKDVVLAISLFSYQPWARLLTITLTAFAMILPAFAIWGVVLLAFDPTESLTGVVDDVFIMRLLPIGLFASLLAVLISSPTRKSTYIGVGIFGVLYILPLIHIILAQI